MAYTTFKSAWNAARSGKYTGETKDGMFKWNNKWYSTRKEGEDESEFRRSHKDYDAFMGHLGDNSSEYWDSNAQTYGGWNVSGKREQLANAENKVPDPMPLPEPAVLPLATTPEVPTRLSMFTNDDIRNLGFKNYSGLVSAVNDSRNADNNFVIALKNRFGDTNNWNQQDVEKQLGVSGKYRSFGGGDFGDMSRSMASYIGTLNGTLDSGAKTYNRTQTRDWMRNNGMNPYDYTGALRQALRHYLNGETEGYDKNLLNGIIPKTSGNASINAAKAMADRNSNLFSFQQGGSINMNEQQIQQLIVQLVQAAMQGDQQATLLIQQIMQAAKSGDLLAKQIAQLIQQVAKQMQGAQSARNGAKLNYIKYLRGQCPEGYEMGYYKAGGLLCKRCMKKDQSGGSVLNDIDRFRCGGKKKKTLIGRSVN